MALVNGVVWAGQFFCKGWIVNISLCGNFRFCLCDTKTLLTKKGHRPDVANPESIDGGGGDLF